MAYELKVIPTLYAGTRFRSRAEARWDPSAAPGRLQAVLLASHTLRTNRPRPSTRANV